MQLFRPIVLLIPALLCGCMNGTTTPARSASNKAAKQTQDERGLAFVEAQCSGCHAVRPGVQPPNPQAPSFVDVANDMGFTEGTLFEFFRDRHDTPAAMSIVLDEDDAKLAAAYIMSLRTPR